MRARLIPFDELSGGDLGRWRDLAERAVEPNPTYEADYLLPLYRHTAGGGAVRLLTIETGGDWCACLPIVDGHWHRIPLASRSSWRPFPLYDLLGTPLLDAATATESLERLVRAMLDSQAKYAVIDSMASDGPVGDALEELAQAGSLYPEAMQRFERASIERRLEPTYFEETLSGKRRKELRRQRRRLAEACGEQPEIADRAGSEAAYLEFVGLEAAEHKASERSPLASDPGHVRWFREMCRSFANRGRLQMLSLIANGETIASQCNLVAGDTLFALKVAYDDRWRTFSPGILMELDVAELFHRDLKLRQMDSCADPNNQTLNRLWPDRRSLTTYAFLPSGARSQIAKPVLQAARSAQPWRERVNRWVHARRHR